MKKMIALLLAALLALGGAACAAAGDVVLGREADGSGVYVRSMFSDGDTLYLVGYGELFTYHLGDAELRQYEYILPDEYREQRLEVQIAPFMDDGRLYAIQLFSRYEENAEFVRASLSSMTLNDDDTAAFEELAQLDWEDMVEYYDSSSYASIPEEILAVNGRALLRVYDNQGSYALKLLEIQTGRITALDDIKDIASMTPYKDGMVLLQQFSYDDAGTVRFLAFDPADESTLPLGEFESESYGAVPGLAYDAQADQAYCIKGGEVCPLDLATGETGEGIADMPLETYGNASACLLEGYYAFAREGLALRSLSGEQPASGKLKVYDSSWSEAVTNAVFRFSNANGDVRTVLSRDYEEGENIIEAMMNRDSSVDIYVMSCSTSEYDAVYNRGYMMELDGAKEAVAFADAAYPALGDALRHNGSVVAVPVSLYGYTLGVNERALEHIGLTIDDVPTNWMDFLDFLDTLPKYMEGLDDVTAFYADFTAQEVRQQLFYSLFNSYQSYVNATDPAMGYNTELLRGLLARLDAVDFEALGHPRGEEDEEDGMMHGGVVIEYSDDDGQQRYELFQTDTGCTFGSFYEEATPVLMAMDGNTDPVFAVECSVAFVNPFTQNPEAALAFMDELTRGLPAIVRYSFDPTLDTPIRSDYYEEELNQVQEEIQNLREQMETADPEEEQELEDMLRSMEESLENIDRYGWDISQRQIDWYRANAGALSMARFNWLYSDGSGEAWELISQYQAGQISGDEMLAAIDKKVQMMLLEGY